MLLQTWPGLSPLANALSVRANPTRAVRHTANGTTDRSNNVRLDEGSSDHSNLTHMSGVNPSLESIEVANVLTGSLDSEQGLAGASPVNLEVNSGTNEVHDSSFW